MSKPCVENCALTDPVNKLTRPRDSRRRLDTNYNTGTEQIGTRRRAYTTAPYTTKQRPQNKRRTPAQRGDSDDVTRAASSGLLARTPSGVAQMPRMVQRCLPSLLQHSMLLSRRGHGPRAQRFTKNQMPASPLAMSFNHISLSSFHSSASPDKRAPLLLANALVCQSMSSFSVLDGCWSGCQSGSTS